MDEAIALFRAFRVFPPSPGSLAPLRGLGLDFPSASRRTIVLQTQFPGSKSSSPGQRRGCVRGLALELLAKTAVISGIARRAGRYGRVSFVGRRPRGRVQEKGRFSLSFREDAVFFLLSGELKKTNNGRTCVQQSLKRWNFL